MGQRLNIEISHEGRTLANCYYHWSAYTIPAIHLVNEIIAEYNGIMSSNDSRLKSTPELIAIRLLEKTGGGITEDEAQRIKDAKLLDLMDVIIKPARSRNDGLISVTAQGMDDTRRWEEGHVDIDLGKEAVWFEVFNAYDRDEWIADECFDDEDYESLHVEQTLDLSEIPFDEFGYVETLFRYYPTFRNINGDVYSEIA